MLTFGRVFGRNFPPSLAQLSYDARRSAINSSAKRSHITGPTADHKVAEGGCLFVCLFFVCSSINVGISKDKMLYLKRSYAKGKKRKERKEEK